MRRRPNKHLRSLFGCGIHGSHQLAGFERFTVFESGCCFPLGLQIIPRGDSVCKTEEAKCAMEEFPSGDEELHFNKRRPRKFDQDGIVIGPTVFLGH